MADFWDAYEKYVKPVTFDAKQKEKDEDLLFDEETEKETEREEEKEKKKFEWDDAMYEDPEFMKVVAEKMAKKAAEQEVNNESE